MLLFTKLFDAGCSDHIPIKTSWKVGFMPTAMNENSWHEKVLKQQLAWKQLAWKTWKSVKTAVGMKTVGMKKYIFGVKSFYLAWKAFKNVAWKSVTGKF